jgi:hypothetical protein
MFKKFFNQDGIYFCETDYFRRLDLLCASCGKALRESYVTGLGKKYHPEHFKCMEEGCNQVFKEYYERDGKNYCDYHYINEYASQCIGCQLPILKEFINLEDGGTPVIWHPECYKMNRLWGIKMKSLPSLTLTRTKEGWTGDNGVLANRKTLMSSFVENEKVIYDTYSTLSVFKRKVGRLISVAQFAIISGDVGQFIESSKAVIRSFILLLLETDSPSLDRESSRIHLLPRNKSLTK